MKHLDQRQPTEVEVSSEDDVDELTRRELRAKCRFTESGVCLNPGSSCICLAHHLKLEKY